MFEEKELLTVKETAEFLGVCEKTIYKLINTKKLFCAKNRQKTSCAEKQNLWFARHKITKWLNGDFSSFSPKFTINLLYTERFARYS